TEVAIDLEWRVCIEHVRISSFRTQKEFKNLIGVVAVCQPRPKVDTPRGRPACRLIASNLERTLDGLRQARRPQDIDVMSREETIEGRYMPVMNLGRFT